MKQPEKGRQDYRPCDGNYRHYPGCNFIALYSMLWIFCHGPSKSARNLFVSTILETGALKFLAGWYFDKDEILEITSKII